MCDLIYFIQSKTPIIPQLWQIFEIYQEKIVKDPKALELLSPQTLKRLIYTFSAYSKSDYLCTNLTQVNLKQTLWTLSEHHSKKLARQAKVFGEEVKVEHSRFNNL